VHMYIDRSDLERAVVAAGRQTPAMLPGEHAGRIWLSLAGIDPGGVPASTSEQDDAAALEKAREVLERRQLGDPGVSSGVEAQLVAYRDALNGQ
jgi:hypothetical protein